MTELISAFITGALAVIGTALGTFGGIKSNQKVIDAKIDELTREVREHNNFARRMPVVEEQIHVINHRLKNLEKRQNI